MLHNRLGPSDPLSGCPSPVCDRRLIRPTGAGTQSGGTVARANPRCQPLPTARRTRFARCPRLERLHPRTQGMEATAVRDRRRGGQATLHGKNSREINRLLPDSLTRADVDSRRGLADHRVALFWRVRVTAQIVCGPGTLCDDRCRSSARRHRWSTARSLRVCSAAALDFSCGVETGLASRQVRPIGSDTRCEMYWNRMPWVV